MKHLMIYFIKKNKVLQVKQHLSTKLKTDIQILKLKDVKEFLKNQEINQITTDNKKNIQL